MTWKADSPLGFEAQKCLPRIVSYLRGSGIDIGCGKKKIINTAIGVDQAEADINLDLSRRDSLGLFADNTFDFVFSSHVLEDFPETEPILAEWWRVLKPGGHMILYGPDPDYYPRIGQEGSNPNHKKDMYREEVWQILENFGNAELTQWSRHNEGLEFSWQIVCRKLFAHSGKIITLSDVPRDAIAFPRKKKTKKECLIIRYGALGDAVMLTPILPKLKADGYHIVMNCTSYCAPILKDNPHIDEFMIQPQDAIENKDLGEYWKTISKGFEKVINLSESIERGLLKLPSESKPQRIQHKECNVNYIDRTMEIAGYPGAKGCLPEIYFSEKEENMGRAHRRAAKGKFVIIWSLSGSAIHKVYPFSHEISAELCKQHGNDIKLITVGDGGCKLIEWQDPITINACGYWGIRDSLVMTKYADLVIGPETGLLNAASAFNTPKICMLSHSSKENLTKYWKNTTTLTPRKSKCPCHPCHKMVYSKEDCGNFAQMTDEEGNEFEWPKCTLSIHPEDILKSIVHYYKQWRKTHA